MADTVRTLSALQALLADNLARGIDAQDVRDMLVSVYTGEILLGEVILSGADGAISFTGLPTTYSDLLYRGVLRSDRAAVVDGIDVRVGNGSVDTGSNYSYLRTRVEDDATVDAVQSGSATAMQVGTAAATTADSGVFTYVEGRVFDYAVTARNRKVTFSGGGYMATGDSFNIQGHGTWKDTTSAVDAVSFIPNSGTNWKDGSLMRIYGVRYPDLS